MVITETNIRCLAKQAQSTINRIYLHWSAGRYDQLFTDYHLNIDGKGQVHQTAENFVIPLSHTWQRNSNSIGISLCCAYNATPWNFGDYPPTSEQIESLCRITAIIVKELGLMPSFETIRTHAEQADLDGYGPLTTCERWDLWMLHHTDSRGSGGKILRKKINFYYKLV